MVETPWGNAAQLRERQLPPGRSTPADKAARNQRERLFAAMVASCETRGYDASSVGDLLELSGISSRTFYQHFTDKQDCFAAAVKEIVATATATISERLGEGEASEERARAAFEAYVDVVVAQPATARMALVETYAVGEPAMAPVREAFDRFARLGQLAFERIPGHAGTPPELARAIVGGFHRVIYTRLLQRREQELPGLVPDLWRWAMNNPPPPQPLRLSSRRGKATPSGAPPFALRNPEQRIIRGFAEAVAEHGYGQATIANICTAASISQKTFYLYFADKADATLAALDSSGAQLLAATLPAARRAADWPRAVRVALGTTCEYLAAEPAFAHLRVVEVYGAGPVAIAARDGSGTDLLRTLLDPAFEGSPEVPPIVAEAILGAIYGVIYERVRSEGPESLPAAAPLLTYVALAPFLGAERACEVANGDGRPGPRPTAE